MREGIVQDVPNGGVLVFTAPPPRSEAPYRALRTAYPHLDRQIG